MSRIRLACRAVALLLVLTIVFPWAAAAAQLDRAVRNDPGRFEAQAPLASLWSWLVGLWENAQPASTDNGCGLDPGGRCLPGTGAAPASAASTDNGCGLDPWGLCHG